MKLLSTVSMIESQLMMALFILSTGGSLLALSRRIYLM